MPLAETALQLLLKTRTIRDEYAASVHSRLLNELVRHAPAHVYVSAAAQREASTPEWRLGDLREYGWYDQVRVMGDVGRKVFAWDHFHTVYELRRRLDALKKPSIIRVRKVLRHASVAWILKTEDAELTRLGYRSRRPDPVAAYREAGIQLLGDPGA